MFARLHRVTDYDRAKTSERVFSATRSKFQEESDGESNKVRGERRADATEE